MKTNIDLLPNLVIAGVAKCGTTSLFSMLGQHPQILASDLKELNYFSPLADGKPLPPLEPTRNTSDSGRANLIGWRPLHATPGWAGGSCQF